MSSSTDGASHATHSRTHTACEEGYMLNAGDRINSVTTRMYLWFVFVFIFWFLILLANNFSACQMEEMI